MEDKEFIEEFEKAKPYLIGGELTDQKLKMFAFGFYLVGSKKALQDGLDILKENSPQK